MSRIVFTGAPGVGKTTLLLALQSLGHTIVGDSARAVIQDRRQRGLSPRPEPLEFAQELLRMDADNYSRHANTPGLVFFDRSVVDALGMLNQVSPLTENELGAWLSPYQYQSRVFVFPPWEAIYLNDSERDHTLEHVEAVHTGVQEWYRHCHYEILEVPRVSVPERCAFVLQALGNSDA